MTLDDAIKHAEEVAEKLENSCKRDWMGEDDKRCASEHRQLAKWLKELKAVHDEIDEIGEKLYQYKCYITDNEGLQHEVIHIDDIRRITGWEI